MLGSSFKYVCHLTLTWELNVLVAGFLLFFPPLLGFVLLTRTADHYLLVYYLLY